MTKVILCKQVHLHLQKVEVLDTGLNIDRSMTLGVSLFSLHIVENPPSPLVYILEGSQRDRKWIEDDVEEMQD